MTAWSDFAAPLASTVAEAPSAGGSPWGTTIIGLFFFVVVALIGWSMASPKDSKWLPVVVMVAFIAKLVGSTTRYLVLVLIYNGRGDATGYHGAGLRLSDSWRSFEVPTTVQRIGTDVVEATTGLLYVPYQPSMLGGFFIFASLAFFGQLLLYAAFRHALPQRHLKWYAAAIFFSPTIVYWPSSIGKESLMLLWIGIASYGAARLFSNYNPAWAGLIIIGLAGTGIIRLHMTLLLAIGMVLALLLARAPRVRSPQARRVLLLGSATVALVLVVVLTAQDFGVDLAAAASADSATDEVGDVFSQVEGQTDRGGSAVSGGAVTSIADVPEAILRVIFRPLPNEADSAPLLIASIEGTILLLIFVLRLPWIIGNLRRLRRYPYLMYAFFYSGGFILAFSAILNLGILARQRSQVMPLFLALLIVLGRKHVEEAVEPAPAPETVPAPRPFELVKG
ncbi:MAG: hypothetical protein ACR2ME_03765 [Acidimicrobiia bacterium]